MRYGLAASPCLLMEPPMADENDALLEAIDKLTEAVDGLEDVAKAHPNAGTKAKVAESLAKVQEGLDDLFKLFPDSDSDQRG
jgi:hypothetical protein